MEETKTVLVFCANEQKETAHTVDIDGNGEVVLTCACGRFLKFPADTDSETLKKYIIAHREQNSGQLSVEAIEAHKAKLIADLVGGDEQASV